MTPSLTFAPEEYQGRLEALREAMELHGLDACVLTSEHNVAYFSGLCHPGFGGPEGMVVTRTDSVTISAVSSGGRAGRRGFGESLAYDDGQRDDFWRLVAAAAGTGKAIGCEADHLTLMQSEKLNAFLKPRRGADIALAAMQQRMVKSDAELGLIRALAEVADLGARVLRNGVKVGAREIDIAGAGLKAMEAEIARLWPDDEYRGSHALLQSGPNSDCVAGSVTSRRLKRGDVIGLTAAPMLGGYGAALKRTLFLGEPDPEGLRFCEAAIAAHVQGPALLKPGVTCGQIADGLDAVLGSRQTGPMRSGEFGGGMTHEPLLAFRADNDTALEIGMVIRLAPWLVVPPDQSGAGGYGAQDMFVITEDGCEALTRFPLGPEFVVAD